MAAGKKLSDDELIALLQKGDKEASAEIYNRYAANLAGFAASKLFSLDDARDLQIAEKELKQKIGGALNGLPPGVKEFIC